MPSKKKQNALLILFGIIVLLVGLFATGMDIYQMSNYERVESTLVVKQKYRKGYTAYASYEYNGVEYEDKGLSYYNAFFMKDGKKFTVLINPGKPEKPCTTSFALNMLAVILGGASIYGVIVKARNESRGLMQ